MLSPRWRLLLGALLALSALTACGDIALCPGALTMPPAPLVPAPTTPAIPPTAPVVSQATPPATSPAPRSTPTPRPRTVALSSPATPGSPPRADPSATLAPATTAPTLATRGSTPATAGTPAAAATLIGCDGEWNTAGRASLADFQEDLWVLLDEYQDSAVGNAGVVIADEEGRPIVAHCAEMGFDTASLYKLFVLWAVQRAIADGELRDDTLLTFLPVDDNSADDGYLLWSYGEEVSVATLRELMIVASNNSAAWLLARTVGWERIDRLLRDQGYKASRALAGTSTPNEIARFFAGVQDGTLDPELRRADYATMLDLLHDQLINGYLSPGFPPGTPFAHKTGNLPGVVNDAGIVTLPDGRTMTIVAMIAGGESASFALLESIAALVWAYYGE